MDAATANTALAAKEPKRRPITMAAIIALVIVAFIALTVLGFAAHLLFSPWVLLAVVAVLAYMKFRPRRSDR
jgi:quinol-cytochrome oxidoreductase complex cytochrome b subunit